jgi:hypothetical protein
VFTNYIFKVMQKLEESKSHGEINPFLLLQEGQFAESEAGLSLINSLPELMDIATYLRNNFSIDYRNIYETSKKLRTLGEPIKKLASQVLDDSNGNISNEESEDS